MRYVKSFFAAFALTLAAAAATMPAQRTVTDVQQAAIDFGDEIWIIITDEWIII